MKRTIVLTGILLFISCSSAPQEQEDVVDVKNQAAEYAAFGNSYYEQGKYEQALNFFNLALEYNITVDNEIGIVQSKNSLGKVYLATGEVAKAEANFVEAYILAQRIDDNDGLSQAANNIGEVYLQQSNFTDALQKFEEALNIKTSIDDGSTEDAEAAILYHNLGTAYKTKGDLANGLTYLEKALEINKALKKNSAIAANYYMIASVYSKQKDYEKALEYANLALDHDKIVENSVGIAKDHYALGLISRKAGKNEDAYEYFKKAVLIYETLDLLQDVLKVVRNLEATARDLGLTEEADRYKQTLQNYGVTVE